MPPALSILLVLRGCWGFWEAQWIPKQTTSWMVRVIPTWVWVKLKPPGIGPQVSVLGSIYQGFILGTYF